MNWNEKNILITGANGFVGSYLAKELLEKGSDVYGFIRPEDMVAMEKNLIDKGIKDKLKMLEGDLGDISSLASALDQSQPDVIFHLAAQSSVEFSFKRPLDTQDINTIGTANLLEAVRIKDVDAKIVFAGSSEVYGMVISSEEQYQRALDSGKTIFPEPEKIPELPISESNPLRPMSPYAVSKVSGDFLMQNYHHSYGLDTVVSRAFNHEGAGRGMMFVTSIITNQIMKLKHQETDRITIGNLNACRDWSHVTDIIQGYQVLASKGRGGEVYNQGSMRTNSVLSYILLGLERAGWDINRIETLKGDEQTKTINNPTEIDDDPIFGVKFDKTRVDQMILENQLEYTIQDKGIRVTTDQGPLTIEFNPDRFRPSEIPLLLCDNQKIQKIGARIEYSLSDVIQDQLDYFNQKENRV
ncbi:MULTISPECIES: GDP-mannose 4,6-dehydratase [Methanobacterium]|jgi:GDPmannose 4,6-dehydratase|uniref:GDP-mannose 4,6-dehydratase n=1 Tax=Methanobacterium subterraneum TaxID=59277 RepID=A0A2H4VPI0_9EURY|nr:MULTISPECIES: GDP-mannose 4,6-dehydratase [Methanobacterium]AUB59003.1 GDP-mannose 4,6-dehydratase [Methanobacterium sp. MZ-A1]AUB60005.1 GDP-mannose 4,6-dehydratase [Methanobacterium subterraneum]MBW4257707.1 GDP-mannose 4,6-dehydratase [Methanobacterium sp. YSL]NMO08673.1 GDP-mannose 4,6-dehydratase [Methanobacterium subterraneum]